MPIHAWKEVHQLDFHFVETRSRMMTLSDLKTKKPSLWTEIVGKWKKKTLSDIRIQYANAW